LQREEKKNRDFPAGVPPGDIRGEKWAQKTAPFSQKNSRVMWPPHPGEVYPPCEGYTAPSEPGPEVSIQENEGNMRNIIPLKWVPPKLGIE